MGNRLAKYDDPRTLKLVHEWYDQSGLDGTDKDLVWLYDSFCEYTLPTKYAYHRVDINMFAKLLVACKIILILNHWQHRPDYAPRRYEIVRAMP